MCSVKFYLDGRSKGNDKTVLVKVNHGGSSFKRTTGIKISVENWNKENGFPLDKTSNEFKRLASIEKNISELVYPKAKEILGRTPSMVELREFFDSSTSEEVTDPGSEKVTLLIQSFIDHNRAMYSNSAIKHYEKLLEHVNIKFGLTINNNVSTVNNRWASDFVDYLCYDDKAGYQNSTVAMFLKKLISVFNFHDLGAPFKVANVMRGMKKSADVNEDKPYLSFEQISDIYDHVFIEFGPNSVEYNVFRMFIFCSNTGMRFNEFQKLKFDMVDDNNVLHYTPTKNNKRISVPLSSLCMQFIEEWKENKTAEMSNSRVNTVLTSILESYGMSNTRSVIRFSGKNREVEEKTLAELISFHSSRRSFVSNLIDNNVPLKDIALVTGISTSTLINYYSSSNQEEVNNRVLEILNR